MNGKFFNIIFLMGLLASCKNNDKPPTAADTSLSDPVILSQQLTDTCFFKTLKGTIAGKSVIMQMIKAGDRMDANYYYVEKGQTIFLQRNWEKVNSDSIYFIEVNSPVTALSNTLAMAISNESLTGIWTSGDGKTTYPINLIVLADSSASAFIAVSAIDSARYLKFKTDTPTLKTTVITIAATDEKLNWLNEKLKQIIDNGNKKFASLSLAQMVGAKVKQDVDAYKADVDSSLVGADDNDLHYFLNREYETVANLVYNDNGYIVVSKYDYAYTGGAHGNYGTSMFCFDTDKKQQIGLSDIVSADNVTMQNLLEQHYRKQYKVPANTPLEEVLFVKHLKPNKNFYFSSAGIGFIYAPYEIASYADGEINVWIPFTALKHFLNPEFAQKMKLL